MSVLYAHTFMYGFCKCACLQRTEVDDGCVSQSLSTCLWDMSWLGHPAWPQSLDAPDLASQTLGFQACDSISGYFCVFVCVLDAKPGASSLLSTSLLNCTSSLMLTSSLFKALLLWVKYWTSSEHARTSKMLTNTVFSFEQWSRHSVVIRELWVVIVHYR